MYNEKKAEELFNSFQNETGIDLLSVSRKTKQVCMRTLFYKVLKDNNNMTEERISQFFADKGVYKNRSSISSALRKVNDYYNYFTWFRESYDKLFNDKLDNVAKLRKKELNRLNYLEGKLEEYKAYKESVKKEKDALDTLVSELPYDKRSDIYEMVNLRVKSWDWKSVDTCKVYEGIEELEGIF